MNYPDIMNLMQYAVHDIGIIHSHSLIVVTAEVVQKIGLEIDNLTPEIASKIEVPSDTEGVVITKVKPGFPGALAGLRPGLRDHRRRGQLE